MAIFYAFATRSVIGGLIFKNPMLSLYYVVMFFCLFYNLIYSFKFRNGGLYAPKGFYSIGILFIFIFLSLITKSDIHYMLYYGIALLLPFSVSPEIEKSEKLSRIFVVVATFFAIGCIINYCFPTIYNTVIFPKFSQTAQISLSRVEDLTSQTYYAGFTSQVGYTSFFLSFGMGALFCFRNKIFRKKFWLPGILIIIGMLLTGKRGPIIFLIVTIAIIYLLEEQGKKRILRIFPLLILLVLGYLGLYFLATYTNVNGIQRIFDTLQRFLLSGDIEDVGREQLYNQAIVYFRQNPILGIGWQNFHVLFTERQTHVHCIYLQLLCETGIIGFCIFVTFFVTCLLRTIRLLKVAAKNTLENNWIKFSLFVQVYFLLYGITGNPLYDIEETILYFFAVSIIYFPQIKKKIYN